jgi:predicted nuclease of predicted toxin-antitoxin system
VAALRLLANENMPGEAVAALRQEGHDVAWVTNDAPGSSDEVVLARAQAEERIVLTFDKDFGELAFRSGLPALCGIILFRIETENPSRATAIITAALRSRSDWAASFTVVEEDRIRMTPLPVAGRGSSEV